MSYCKPCSAAKSSRYYAEKQAAKPPRAPKTEKRCPHCQVVKPYNLEHFQHGGIRKNGSIGVGAWCRECFRADQRARHLRQPEAMRTRAHNRRARVLAAGGVIRKQDVKLKLQQQGMKCYWCQKPLEKYHIDHVVPIAKGGTNGPENIACTCPECNWSKSDKMPWEFAGRLL